MFRPRSTLLRPLTLGCALLAAPLFACGTDGESESSGEAGEAGEGEAGDTSEASSSATSVTSTTTSATGSTDDSSSTSADGSTTSSFVNNDTTMGCGTECNIWAPTECPDGEKCTAVACEVGSNAWDSNVCLPVEGDKLAGDDCEGAGVTGFDDCDEGLMCWDADPDTGLGTCISFCQGSPAAPNCPTAGQLCAQANDGTLPICLDKCDPLSADCPDADDLCIPNPGEPGFVCVLDASGGMAPYGTPCNGPNEDDNSCNTGLICIPSEGVPSGDCGSAPGCCSPICDVTAANNCPGAAQGQQCLPFYPSTVPGYEDVGICSIPQ